TTRAKTRLGRPDLTASTLVRVAARSIATHYPRAKPSVAACSEQAAEEPDERRADRHDQDDPARAQQEADPEHDDVLEDDRERGRDRPERRQRVEARERRREHRGDGEGDQDEAEDPSDPAPREQPRGPRLREPLDLADPPDDERNRLLRRRRAELAAFPP